MSQINPGQPATPAGTSKTTRAWVRFLAGCNVVGFVVLFGFIGAGNLYFRWLVDAIDAPVPGFLATLLGVPSWFWIVAFLAGSGVVALVDRVVRTPAISVLAQTGIGIVQIAAVAAYGLAWIAYLLPLMFGR